MLFWVLALPGGSLRACAFALFFGQIHTLPRTHKHPPPYTHKHPPHTPTQTQHTHNKKRKSGQESLDRTGRTGLEWQNKIARTGLSGKDYEDWAARTGPPGQD
jgi:hypothetical protein